MAASSQVHAKQPPQKASVAPAAPKFTLAVPAAASDLTNTKSVEYEDAQLEAIMKQFVASHSDHEWSISLQGLGSDERAAAYDPSAVFRSASMFKLLLMYPLIQRTPIDQWPSVDLDVNGKTKTLDACVQAMLKVSDNSCGKAVGDYVGWAYADAQLKMLGLQRTTLNDDSGPKTTAGDVAFYLQGLYEGKWFDGATRAYIVKTLDQQILRAGIPTGCGSACAVADKTGDLGFVRHDAGVIRYAGGAYVLSVFSDGASYSQIADLADQLQTFMAAN
ncbi:MAG TPA: serine hydrolase [Candidatus Saccharimonadales bacterium]|nr:serine hydrolase [Candidatus Saccharimonadales bacterium]